MMPPGVCPCLLVACCHQGVHVHGYEPSPFFDEQDPYWEVHNDSRFAPQPGDYVRLNSTAMIMKTWLWNRTAWLLHSQVCWLVWKVHLPCTRLLALVDPRMATCKQGAEASLQPHALLNMPNSLMPGCLLLWMRAWGRLCNGSVV
jgi:hypothetical protein